MTQLTKQEREDLKQYSIGPDDVIHCPECGRMIYKGLDECRYCEHRLVEKEPENDLPDEEFCPVCENHMMYNEETGEWYCPLDHSPSIFEF